jgi:tRNA threonylcarbamoyladenosine biosynthesis protein TsaE
MLCTARMTDTAALVVQLRTRGDTRRIGRRLAECLAPGDLIVLEGELGAGKTFFVRAIARGLGVPAAVRVTSPTFDLLHELPGRLPILHADLYRLSDAGELRELGLIDRIEEGAVVLVEWGERFAEALATGGLHAVFTLDAEGGRSCAISPRGARGEALLSCLRGRLSGDPRCGSSG